MSTSEQQITPPIDSLIVWLQGLVERQERGVLAELRRGLMLPREQLYLLYSAIPPQHVENRGRSWADRNEEVERRFLIASLFALHPVSFSDAELAARRRNIGDSLRLLAIRQRERRGPGESPDEPLLSEPLKRRMDALLASRSEELFEHLRHVVRLFKTEEIPVDWDQLLKDLRRWDDPERSVQWRWSRSFYVGYHDRD